MTDESNHEHDKPNAAQSGRTRSPLVAVLIALLVFQGLSAVAGGYALMADPSGEALGIDRALLEGSAFRDFRVPGAILFGLLGFGPLVAAYGVARKTTWGWWGALCTGIGLVVWIGVQVGVIGYVSWPPLQAFYALLGLAILGVTVHPATRRGLGF